MTRILCGTLLATAVLAQQSGDVPSELVWDSKAGVCPASLTWASLRGSVVVVGFPPEFTFPEEIVQWNKLPDKFAGEPIVFIQVATGPEFFLDQALKKAPYHGCVLFDGRNANRSNYELPTFPRAIVVDSQGWIAGYARGDIDEETLRAVLDHKEASGLRARPPQPTPYDLLKLDSAPSYEVHISPAATGELRRSAYLHWTATRRGTRR